MGTSTVMSEEALSAQISYMKTILNERQYRCYLGKTALSLGRGGQTTLHDCPEHLLILYAKE